MNNYSVYEIVKKFIGATVPIGESNIDEKRLENLKDTISLVQDLLGDIAVAARYHNRQEYSMKTIGIVAKEFIDSLTSMHLEEL